MNGVPLRDGVDPVDDEARRLRRLRLTVDAVAALLAQQNPLTEREADRLIEGARMVAVSLFPETFGAFDLIIRPRFQRILRERGFEL